MANGANGVHLQLRHALENYIKSQYFGKSPILRAAIEDKLDQEGVLYQKPYIESSPAYKSEYQGIQKSKSLPDWLKDYFHALSDANLGVYPSPFCHQISALEAAYSGQDLFVATGTGSGKTECFMWPLMAKLAEEAKETPDNWSMRGVRTIIMYPMNALVSDQLSRLRRLIGDPEHKFVSIFRNTCGKDSRRPQFGMYTGRTPYAGEAPKKSKDGSLAKTYAAMVHPKNDDENEFLQKLIKDGKLPAKENFDQFLENLSASKHIPDDEDAELVTRFEMQQFCPDILITNYSMLEYMLLRPRENKIWADTKAWLDADQNNKLLFVIDEAHMYRGSSGGEVSLLIRRLFHRLGINRGRVQFILTTASMPNQSKEDEEAVRVFANQLTASDDMHLFCYLTGEQEEIGGQDSLEIPFSAFEYTNPDAFEGEAQERLAALNTFWSEVKEASIPVDSIESASQWLYENLVQYKPFLELFKQCRGKAVSLKELAETIFPEVPEEKSLHAVSVLLAIAPLARSKDGSVLFPARMHMLFRGIKGVYVCTNPNCPHAHTDGNLTLGEIYFDDGNFVCKECGSAAYELYNDRRCGSLFLRGFVLKNDFDNRRKTYLWHDPGMLGHEKVSEIHLFIPDRDYRLRKNQGKNKIQPCYLDTQSGFIDFSDDSLAGQPGIRKLYYMDFTAKGRPDVITFSKCPHCEHTLSTMQLTSFSTRGNQSFFNLVQEQFLVQPAVSGKTGDLERLPNEGRKVLLFSDSRQRAAKLARDMSDASDSTVARQLVALAINKMEQNKNEYSMDYLYNYFALSAAEKHARLFHNDDGDKLMEDGRQALEDFRDSDEDLDYYEPDYTASNAPDKMLEQLMHFYCGGYNTLIDTGIGWIEPMPRAKNRAMKDLKAVGLNVSEEEFMEVFNAWVLYICDSYMALGHTISDTIRSEVRHSYNGYGVEIGQVFSKNIREIMGWEENGREAEQWALILKNRFLDKADNDRYYLDLSRIKPRFDLNHQWYRCDRCSELTPYLLKGKCPSCQSDKVHKMSEEEIKAMDFWRKPIYEALDGKAIRSIDTEEHTAQLSHKDQEDSFWSKTEEYELRFQDFLQEGQSPVDILSSTTTMEVGIDIGSLVAVGLRNIPPMRENYQQRAGRAGRRGSSLSTIVTFCEDGPHDSLYFNNPVPMFRGDPRRPWIDVSSEKIVQRHLGMIALQSYLRTKSKSLDAAAAIDFLDEELFSFENYLGNYDIAPSDILIPFGSEAVLKTYKSALIKSLKELKRKRDAHPELFETGEETYTGRKSLLDALYEEGAIPTYSFPKNVVSMYIQDSNGKIKYQVERGLDVALGEYAPGRAIVVDKATYQIGGLFYPRKTKGATAPSPTSSFLRDENYNKPIQECNQCDWFGLKEEGQETCPFCGSPILTSTQPMVRPWGFAPRNGEKIEPSQLEEEYTAMQQPLYSTLLDAKDINAVAGYLNMKMAVRSNQRIIMLNKGRSGQGFIICTDCGAIMPWKEKDALKSIKRPYKVSGTLKQCKHENTLPINLGYDFVTDMLVLEFELDYQKLDTSTKGNTWLRRAGQSLAEGLRLAVCKKLDIEFTELVTGYRIRKNFVDVYLYDSLSSGAGYAVSLQESIQDILEETRELLSQCSCDSACHQCLKHYRNQFVHGHLDRKAALDLLDWGRTGKRATALSVTEQKNLVKPLLNILNSYGVQVELLSDRIMVLGKISKKKLEIYPAMWRKPTSVDTIYVSELQMKFAKPVAVQEIVGGV